MVDDRPADDRMEALFQLEREVTKEYQDFVRKRLDELVQEHLSEDVRASLDRERTNEALSAALRKLIESDRELGHDLRKVIRDEAQKHEPGWGTKLSFSLLGSVITLVLFGLGAWGSGMLTGRADDGPGSSLQVDGRGGAGPEEGPGEEEASDDIPDYVAIFDERFATDLDWSSELRNELRDSLSEPVQLERPVLAALDAWEADQTVDADLLRRALAHLILKVGGLDIDPLDGTYSVRGRTGDRVLADWTNRWLIRVQDGIPEAPLEWREDPNTTFEPFEKYVIAEYLEEGR